MSDKKKVTLSDVKHVRLVTIGGVNPNQPVTEAERNEQLALLNTYINENNQGIIIGKDITVGQYMIGGHQLTMEKVTYHIGFDNKPKCEEED